MKTTAQKLDTVFVPAGTANTARLTALESQIASLQERDAKREENAKKRLENMPHLVALLNDGENKLSDILQRLNSLEQIDRFRVKSDWIKQVNDRLQSIEQYARTESKIREAQEAIHELETEIAAEETPQPLTPVQVRQILKDCNARQVSDKHLAAVADRINQHFLGGK